MDNTVGSFISIHHCIGVLSRNDFFRFVGKDRCEIRIYNTLTPTICEVGGDIVYAISNNGNRAIATAEFGTLTYRGATAVMPLNKIGL